MKKVIISHLFAFLLFFGAQSIIASATENDIISTLEASSYHPIMCSKQKII